MKACVGFDFPRHPAMISPSGTSRHTTYLSDPLPAVLVPPRPGVFLRPVTGVFSPFDSGAGVWADNPIVADVLLLGASVLTRGVQVRQAA